MTLPTLIAVSLILHGSGALGCLDYGLKYYEYEKRKKYYEYDKRKKRTTSTRKKPGRKFVAVACN